ncbi:hypothetical protein [Frondihabitans australicus]|uniref:Uncharacterized protein n=1 Tax=Frondihabitans australicus TaxID=386892 RepID=A0A495IHK0_9MICO|nr:hypothetical protein [Frondihabitans australicus]RKR75239.1 hypothetical protein C8E83_2377 [Frondihabitans australicus]
MGITFDLGIQRRRERRGSRQHAAALADAEARAKAELEHIIAAARLVVSTRFASATLLVSRLGVTEEVAGRILHRLEHCEVIAPAQAGRDVQTVLTTPAQLPGVIREFQVRG